MNRDNDSFLKLSSQIFPYQQRPESPVAIWGVNTNFNRQMKATTVVAFIQRLVFVCFRHNTPHLISSWRWSVKWYLYVYFLYTLLKLKQIVWLKQTNKKQQHLCYSHMRTETITHSLNLVLKFSRLSRGQPPLLSLSYKDCDLFLS